MAFNWEIKSTFDSTPRDRPAVKVKVALPLFKALHGNASKTPGHWLPQTQWSDYFKNVNDQHVTIFIIFKLLLE